MLRARRRRSDLFHGYGYGVSYDLFYGYGYG